LHLVQRYGVTNAFLFPTALKMMMRSDAWADARGKVRLRAIMSAGEAVGTAVFDWTREALGVTVNEMFGQTEMNYVVGNSHEKWPARPGSMGRPYPGHRVAVIDDDGRELPAGETGEVAVHRRDIHGDPDPVFFLEYWRNPEATRKKFTGAIDDSWCRTGDLASRDADGYLWYRGRADDMFKAAGYRIGPSEIENCLLKHPAVANVAVVPKPDPERGNVVKAFVVLAPGHAGDSRLIEALQAHVRGKLAPYEYPKEIEFVAELPMTTTGKVQRRVLRERELARARGALGEHARALDRRLANRVPDGVREQLLPLLRCAVDQRRYAAGRQRAQAVTQRKIVQFAPAALDQPTPKFVAHAGRHAHAQIGAVDRGTDAGFDRRPPQLVALAALELFARRRRQKRQPAHCSSDIREPRLYWPTEPDSIPRSGIARLRINGLTAAPGSIVGDRRLGSRRRCAEIGRRAARHRAFDGLRQHFFALLRRTVDQLARPFGGNLAIAAAVRFIGDFAPAARLQPVPQLVRHAGLHRHAQIVTADARAHTRAWPATRRAARLADVQQRPQAIPQPRQACHPSSRRPRMMPSPPGRRHPI
jgi:hypothetical protein